VVVTATGAMTERIPVTIRPMTAADVPQVMPIEREAFPEFGHGTPLYTELESKLARYLVAVVPADDGTGLVVGYAGLWFVLDEAHLTAVAVLPALRRHGIAKQLMMAAVGLAFERRCSLLTLEVRASNTAAQELYRTLGMRKVGVRRGYYSDNREDAWLMTVEGLNTPEVRQALETLRGRVAPEIPAFPVKVENDD
jgi:[ribosomal protein S18]-alanine N-acetyltransferase